MALSELDVERAVDEVFGGAARTVSVHASGAVSVVVKAGEHVVVVDGTAAQTEWGVSVDPGDDEGFGGHDVTTASLAEALLAAQDAIRG